jgi:D-alanine--D-alanine ligase
MNKKKKSTHNNLTIALLCGGPSLERGISLNSARSVCDHLQSDSIQIEPVYFDHQKKCYRISKSQLYSNTPSDFDFKLQSTAKALSQQQLIKFFKGVDLVFPVMHGPFGEDGQIQSILEKSDIAFIGTGSKGCSLCFDKFEANEFIRQFGFTAPASISLKKGQKNLKKVIRDFFNSHQLKRAIVKPATGGSSIAVYSVSTVDEALEKVKVIFSERVDKRVVLEPFCHGIEFTVIILENRFGLPVAILPTEIELDYRDHQIFDYRRKYLATRQVTYHCPPRFDDDVLERIQIQAEQLYKLFGMRDFARFDGWLLPDGQIWFSDFNPISGMEQNSFLFMQAARIGMSHRDTLRHIVRTACARYNIKFPLESEGKQTKKKEVNVLFGGATAERQVSLMSGTNVWLKLRRSKKYFPKPFLLDAQNNVWSIPYGFALNHTVEEVLFMCKSAERDEERLARLKTRIVDKLSPEKGDISEQWFLPEKMSLDEFIKRSNMVFIGLHGGIGEDGRLQKMLEDKRVPFNGPGSASSKLCMNKYLTGEVVRQFSNDGIQSAKKRRAKLNTFKSFNRRQFFAYWQNLTRELSAETIIVKPLDDGCSAGIARLYTAEDLRSYCEYALRNDSAIPVGLLTEQHGIIEMPSHPMKTILFEEFVETDKLFVEKNKLYREEYSGWIEITVGLLEKNGKMKSLSPSITVASGNILTLEEKFQGGTGINITPLPKEIVSSFIISKAKKRIELVATALGLQGYARIDAFLNTNTGELIIIEANTLPGLTAATVIFHQALAEVPSIAPVTFLERILENAESRYKYSISPVELPKVVRIH